MFLSQPSQAVSETLRLGRRYKLTGRCAVRTGTLTSAPLEAVEEAYSQFSLGVEVRTLW